jgi:hypothetical protein
MQMRSLFATSAVIVMTAALTLGAHSVTLDFESGDAGWEFIDEDVSNLGDPGPGEWSVRASELGLDGNALYQASNIWGTPGDTMLVGTFAIYTAETFGDFTLTMDVAAADNDGWPSPPLDGNSGPMAIMHKRISDSEPWYELLDVQHNDTGYVDYPVDGTRMGWTLTVANGQFAFESDHGASVSGSDSSYAGGYIGLQMYAQQSEFDNIVVTPANASAVDADGKATTVWASIKAAR